MPTTTLRPPSQIAMQQLRLSLAYKILLEASAHAPPSGIRNLILDVDLTVASFGVGFNDRENVTCPDSDLTAELVAAAAPLVRISEDLHDELLGEIELALARHAPQACIFYIAKSKLWECAPETWSRLIGLLVRHVTNTDAQHAITAVIAQRILGGEGIDEA